MTGAFVHLFNQEMGGLAGMFQQMSGYPSAEAAIASAKAREFVPVLSENEQLAVDVFDAALSNVGLELAANYTPWDNGRIGYNDSVEFTQSGIEREQGGFASYHGGSGATLMVTGKFVLSNEQPDFKFSAYGTQKGWAAGLDMNFVTSRDPILKFGNFGIFPRYPIDLKFKFGIGTGAGGEIDPSISKKR